MATPYVLWLEWIGFYTASEESPQPEIVTRDRTVLDANGAARKCGVRPGMHPRRAKTLANGCIVTPWQTDHYQERQNAWLDRCTDITGMIEPVDQHIAALDLSAHAHPFDLVEKLVRALLDHARLPLRYGIGPAKWIAQLAAEDPGHGNATEDPAGFLAPRPVGDLLPVPVAHRQRLEFLGYRTIGSVARLPLAILAKQFDKEALLIQRCAQGKHADPVRALYPPGCLRECHHFMPPIQDYQALLRVVDQLANRIGQRLLSRGEQTSQMEVSLETEDGETQVRSRRFTRAIHHALSVRSALKLLLSGAEGEITAPVVTLRIYLPDLAPVRAYQPKLIDTLHHAPRKVDSEAAVDRVRAVFGDGAVRMGAEIVTSRRMKVLKEWSAATGWR